MLAWLDYVRFGVTLFSIVDPFAAIPVFLVLTEGRSPAYKARTARTVGVAVFGMLVISAFSGDFVLRLIGASLEAFQVAGGIVLLLMALAMVNAQLSPQQQTREEADEAEVRDAIAIVPIAMPLLVGPGSISATIIHMQRGTGMAHQAVVIGVVLVVCVLLWLILRLAVPIGKRLGRTGLNILNRIFGLLLASIAVQIFATGLRGLFPVLDGP
jgi:multiple antibiotic resistance protein